MALAQILISSPSNPTHLIGFNQKTAFFIPFWSSYGSKFDFLNLTHICYYYTILFQELIKTYECFREISYETKISTAMWPTDNYWVCFFFLGVVVVVNNINLHLCMCSFVPRIYAICKVRTSVNETAN
jgi:hypothetical protein